MDLLVICVSSLGKCLFRFFAHFLIVFLLLSCMSYLHFLNISSLIRYMTCRNFVPSCVCFLFIFFFLMVSFEGLKFLILIKSNAVCVFLLPGFWCHVRQ